MRLLQVSKGMYLKNALKNKYSLCSTVDKIPPLQSEDASCRKLLVKCWQFQQSQSIGACTTYLGWTAIFRGWWTSCSPSSTRSRHNMRSSLSERQRVTPLDSPPRSLAAEHLVISTETNLQNPLLLVTYSVLSCPLPSKF